MKIKRECSGSHFERGFMKECVKCLEKKKNSEFYITKTYEFSNAKYYDSVCKQCRHTQRRKARFTKEEKIKKWNEKVNKVWSMGKWLKKNKK